MGSTLCASCLTALFVSICVQVVVVHVFRREFTVFVALVNAASIRDVLPAGLGLVSVQDVATIVPFKPSPDALGKVPNLFAWLLMKPVSHGAFKTVGVREDLLRELVLEVREHIIERKGVGGKVHPTRVARKAGHSLSGPETIGLFPDGNIGRVLLRVSSQVMNIKVPFRFIARAVQVLLENTLPLCARDAFLNFSVSGGGVHVRKLEAGGKLDVASELLVSLMPSVVDRSTLELDDTSKTIQVVDCSCCCDFSTVAVSTDSCHSDLVLIHESNDISAHIFHIIGGVVIRTALISVVKEPNIAELLDLVIGVREELLEVFCRLNQLGQPNHSGQVLASSGKESTLELNI